jgi:hypothetical protein
MQHTGKRRAAETGRSRAHRALRPTGGRRAECLSAQPRARKYLQPRGTAKALQQPLRGGNPTNHTCAAIISSRTAERVGACVRTRAGCAAHDELSARLPGMPKRLDVPHDVGVRLRRHGTRHNLPGARRGGSLPPCLPPALPHALSLALVPTRAYPHVLAHLRMPTG